MGITTVEKHDVFAIFLNQLVDLVRLQVRATTNDTAFIDIKLVLAILKSYQLASNLHAHARKIVTTTITPLENDVFELRVLLGRLDVSF